MILLQGLAALGLGEQVGEGVAQADDGVKGPLDLFRQVAPVGQHRRECQPPTGGVGLGLGQHGRAAVHAHHLEAGLREAAGMKPGAGGHVQHPAGAVAP